MRGFKRPGKLLRLAVKIYICGVSHESSLDVCLFFTSYLGKFLRLSFLVKGNFMVCKNKEIS